MEKQKPFLVLASVLILAVTAALCLPCVQMSAQAPSADYTNDLPTVERVKAEIKGSDPTDTLARQVAVFTYLQTYIERIKYNRTVSGDYTPGEARARAAYALAAYNMSQEYAKTHTPAEALAFERLHGQYEMNDVFYKDWTKRLIGPQTTAAYKGAESGLAATQKKHYDQQMADYKRDSAAQQAADKQVSGTQGLSNDPTAVATRRCLELGGSNAGCMGKGFMSGLKDLIGFTPDVQESLIGPDAAGAVLNGQYRNPAITTSLNFNGGVTINGCGKLVADPHHYTIDKRPGSLRVTIDNEPDPIVLTMRPDGGLTGPGLVEVKGLIIIGYHTVTSTLMINGVRAAPDQCNGPCQTVSNVPDYAPATARCTIGSLSMPPPPKPVTAGSQPADSSGMMGMVTGVADMLSPGGGAQESGGGGLRMTGKYGGGMLLLDFSGNSLVLDCGQAHVRAPYTVENAPNTLLIHVQNPGGPFNLSLQPDNSLRGSGSTAVNGRLVTGMQGEEITFAPHSETCEVGSFRPKTGAAPTTAVATATPAPATASPVSAASSLASSDITLAIATSFPDRTNPLAGRVVKLMTERYDIALRKVGAPIPEGTTPGQALQAYSNNCPPPNGCPGPAKLMHPYFVGTATFDSNGKATLTAPVPPGSYYVLCSANSTRGPMVWDVPVALKAGGNSIALSATNAEILK